VSVAISDSEPAQRHTTSSQTCNTRGARGSSEFTGYDGNLESVAGGLRKLWYVTLPLQLPIALVALLFGIVFTATDMAVVYILTAGGPFNSTQIVTTWAFQTGIESGSLGEGAAVSLLLLPVLAAVAIAMLIFARRAEVA